MGTAISAGVCVWGGGGGGGQAGDHTVNTHVSI